MRYGACMLVSLVLVLLASLDGDAAFAAGRASYDQLEYEQAVFRFQEVAIRSDLSDEDKATAFVWLGVSYGSVGDAMAARRAFSDALRANPAQTLPVEVSPKIEQLFAEAKAALPATSTTATSTTSSVGTGAPSAGPADNTMAIAAASTGAVLVVAGLGLSAICAATFAQASDPDAFQADAKASLDAANLELVAASVAIPLGLALGGVAGFLFTQPGPDGADGG